MNREILLTKQIITNSLQDFSRRIKTENENQITLPNCGESQACFYLQNQNIKNYNTKFDYHHYICHAKLTSFDASVQAFDKNNIENKLLSEHLSYQLQKALYSNMTSVYGIKFIEHLQNSWKAFFKSKFCQDKELDEMEYIDLLNKQEETTRQLELLQETLS